jgi:hypothetical protein
VNLELLQTFDGKEAFSKAQGENQTAAPQKAAANA